MRKIKEGELFDMGGSTYKYRLNDSGGVILSIVLQEKAKKGIEPPSEEEVKKYAEENGYNPDFMWEKMQGYILNDMKDSHGNPVKNWKLKLNQVWFKPENKVKTKQVGMVR